MKSLPTLSHLQCQNSLQSIFHKWLSSLCLNTSKDGKFITIWGSTFHFVSSDSYKVFPYTEPKSAPLEISLCSVPVLPSEATLHVQMFQGSYSAPLHFSLNTHTHNKHQAYFHGMWFWITPAFSHHFGFCKFNTHVSWLLLKLCV